MEVSIVVTKLLGKQNLYMEWEIRKKIYVACVRWNKTWSRFRQRNNHSYVHHITVCFIEKCWRNSFWVERSALQTKIENILNLIIWIENRAVTYIVLSCLLLLLFIPLICASNNIVYRICDGANVMIEWKGNFIDWRQTKYWYRKQ